MGEMEVLCRKTPELCSGRDSGLAWSVSCSTGMEVGAGILGTSLPSQKQTWVGGCVRVCSKLGPLSPCTVQAGSWWGPSSHVSDIQGRSLTATCQPPGGAGGTSLAHEDGETLKFLRTEVSLAGAVCRENLELKGTGWDECKSSLPWSMHLATLCRHGYAHTRTHTHMSGPRLYNGES